MESFNSKELQKAFIFFCTIDIDDFTNYKIGKVPPLTQSQIGRELSPMLKKDDSTSIKEMVGVSKSILKELFNFNKEEKEFISMFYKKNTLAPELLFQSKDFDFLKECPLAKWKLKKLAMNKDG